MTRSPAADSVVQITTDPAEAGQTVAVVGDQVITATPADAGKVVTVDEDGLLVLGEAEGNGTYIAASALIDDDTMATATATNIASAESSTAYTDNAITDLDELAAGVRTTLDTGVTGFVGVDVDLASGVSGGDTVTGGTGASENLTLASTANAARGNVQIRDAVVLLTEDKTHTSSAEGFNCILIPAARTIVLEDTGGELNVGNTVTVISFRSTVVYEEASNLFTAASLFQNLGVFKNANGEARSTAAVQALVNSPTYQGDGAALSTNHEGVRDTPIFSVINSGTVTAGAVQSFISDCTANAGATVTLRKALSIADATGAGTVTTQVGVDIAALAKGATNIGIRNASTQVDTPSVATLSAVGSSITPNAAVKRLNNTSGGPLTLTSAPTIADGQDGQRLLLFNGSGNAVTLSDQGTLASSNLRLSASTITLGTRDSIELMYSTTIGDWIQTGQTNVI